MYLLYFCFSFLINLQEFQAEFIHFVIMGWILFGCSVKFRPCSCPFSCLLVLDIVRFLSNSTDEGRFNALPLPLSIQVIVILNLTCPHFSCHPCLQLSHLFPKHTGCGQLPMSGTSPHSYNRLLAMSWDGHLRCLLHDLFTQTAIHSESLTLNDLFLVSFLQSVVLNLPFYYPHGAADT